MKNISNVRQLIQTFNVQLSDELKRSLLDAENFANMQGFRCNNDAVIFSLLLDYCKLYNYEDIELWRIFELIFPESLSKTIEFCKKKFGNVTLLNLYNFIKSLKPIKNLNMATFLLLYIEYENNPKTLIGKLSKENKEELRKNLVRTEFFVDGKFPNSYNNKNIRKNNIYSDSFDMQNVDDWTFKAYKNEFEPIYGRHNELANIKRILCKKLKNNPLLIGKPGVGKTHIIEQLAIDLVNNDVPEYLKGYRLLSISVTSIISGTKYRGDLEQKVENFFNSIKGEKVIVFIDEVHLIENKFSEDSNLGDCLKTYFLNPDYKIIGATTNSEYRLIERDPAIQRRFDNVNINESTINETIDIIKNSKKYYEEFYNIDIPEEIVKSCVELSERYICESSLPDKAINILDEACSYAVYDLKENILKVENIYKAITEKTGIPIEELTEKSRLKLLNIEEILNKEIIGQKEAISKIVKALKKTRLGLGNPNSPIGTYLFAGKTGVGKTETAKVLAKQYYNGKNSLIRIDMSEYQNKESIQRLIGTAPGYIGYQEGGQLTEAIKHNPYAIVLFDEIEKAHPEVLNVLLQILDDGILTDGKGKTVNFKNTFIILTTNLGSDILSKISMGFGENIETKEKEAINEIKKTLKPEIFNRIDEVVIFKGLKKADCEFIAKQYIENISKNLSENKNIELEFGNEILKYIVKIGYSEEFGAREIIRTIEREIVSKISDAFLEHSEIKKLCISLENDEVRINTITNNEFCIA